MEINKHIIDIYSRAGGAEVGAENRKIYLGRVINTADSIITRTYKNLPIPKSVRLNYKIGEDEALRIQREVDDPRFRKHFDRLYIIRYKQPSIATEFELNIYIARGGLTSKLFKTDNPDSEHHYYKVEVPQNIAIICKYLNLLALVSRK